MNPEMPPNGARVLRLFSRVPYIKAAAALCVVTLLTDLVATVFNRSPAWAPRTTVPNTNTTVLPL
ncbi:hypothetical protein NQ317_012186 [Molorchus minor]|uniref:Uncharacterized protein n=1 Tax=Molorchus minor TaxID=1323400 RepID=A0ABQ9K2Y7_9CUCU|nr:hypothetical protein NQ317_012186 [Molorchus minor]